jgi:glutamate/tyrosine decarboxylase-like PLP-dependent enzyme
MALTTESQHACFLGPYGENDTLLEKLVVEFLRDHVYWRRNFHPEDPPAIPTRAAADPAYRDFEARLRRELHHLSATLKRSVPFHSPRYLGHMVSDLLLPGLAAQILTLPYNPNNVSEDAAPVTVDLEVQVGLQFARMLGYPSDPARGACGHGHLTSGGTVANYQALRLALAVKAFPVALRHARVPDLELPDDDVVAFNLAPVDAIELFVAWEAWLRQQPAGDQAHWRRAVDRHRLETLGLHAFFQAHRDLSVPCVLAPASAHYSWSKGVKLLGLGREQLVRIPQDGMRVDADALADQLDGFRRRQRSVLMAVAVLGSTEFGTIDPVHRMVDLRDRSTREGNGFWLHVDAAWGGYLATLFRNEDGSLRGRGEIAALCESFPSPVVHAAFEALSRTDSTTIDPHKLGYIAYGAGAFVGRDHRALRLLAEEADYVFQPDDALGYEAQQRRLGQYILEGSKPGAAAAAVYVTHRVLPLDHANFGFLQAQTLHAAERFLGAARAFAAAQEAVVHVTVPFVPDTNLVCVAINPAGNRDLGQANAWVRALHDRIRCDPTQPVQVKEFFGSVTTLRRDVLGDDAWRRILGELKLETGDDNGDGDHLVVLRHTLMNPYLVDHENGISYIDAYFAFLARHARQGAGLDLAA